MTDYYKLLNVDPSASTEEIQAAIKKTRRLWNTRSTNPNADIRAEAEQCIRDIAQAEKILLDPAERANYDASLLQGGNEAPVSTTQPSNNDDSWLEQANYYRHNGDYYSVISLMQNVVNSQPQNALAWYVLGDSYQNQENDKEAERCLRQSIRLNPNDERPYESLGFVYWNNNLFSDAYQCFEKAAELAPDVLRLKCGCAEILRIMNRMDEALDIIEKVYRQDQNYDFGKSIYFSCLRDHIYNAVSYNRNSGRHLIINLRQLEFVKQYLPRLSSMVSPNERDQVRVEEDLRQMVIAAEKTHGLFSKPGYVKNYEMSSDEVRRTGLQ